MNEELNTVHISYYPHLGIPNAQLDNVNHFYFNKDEPYIVFYRINGQVTRIAANAVVGFDVIPNPPIHKDTGEEPVEAETTE